MLCCGAERTAPVVRLHVVIHFKFLSTINGIVENISPQTLNRSKVSSFNVLKNNFRATTINIH